MVGSVLSRRRLAVGIAAVCAVACTFIASAPAGAVRTDDSASLIDIEGQPFAFTSSTTSRFRIVLPFDVSEVTSIRIELHRRATSRTAINLIADGDAELRVIDSAQFPVSTLSRFDSRGLVVAVPFQLGGQSSAINLPYPGIFPVTISAIHAGSTMASTRTFVASIDPADSATPVSTSIVVSQEAAPSLATDGTLAISPTTRSAVRKLVTMLNNVRAPLTVQLQPETVAALAASELPDDKVLLNTLAASLSGHTVVASTFVPMDPGSAQAAGLDAEFTRQLRLGETTLQQLLPTVRVSRSAWITHTPITVGGASLLRNLGVTSIVSIPVPTDTGPPNATTSLVAHAVLEDGSLVSMLTADNDVTRILDDPSRDDVQNGVRLAAEVLAARQELLATGSQPSALRIVVGASSSDMVGATALTALSRALASTPGITIKDFSVGLPPSDATPDVEFATTPDRDVSLIGAALFSVGLDRIAVGSMLPSDSPDPVMWDRMLSVIPASTLANPNDYVLGVRKLMRAVKLGVVPPAASTFTLGDKKATIRLQIRNSSTNTLKVRVTLTSAKLLFPEPPQIVELVPNASTDVVVPVVARSNGRFPVIVRITTPTGNARVTTPIILTARVNIIAGLGQTISFVALLLLLVWWVVSWSRSRRHRRATTVVAQ